MSIVIDALAGPVTLQDLGRLGHRHLGVSWQGAMDQLAYESANWLCGNPSPLAALEIGPGSLTLSFERAGYFAYCGMAHRGRLLRKGEEYRLFAGWRYPFENGDTLVLSPTGEGVYGYLALRGGVDLPPLMNSCSTDPDLDRTKLPTRPLQRGERLPLGDQAAPLPRVEGIAQHPHNTRLRYLPAREDQAPSMHLVVSRSVSRMGIRLNGNQPYHCAQEAITKPVFPGAIQLPPDGQPIVLTRGCQTTGGYPVLGYLLQPDLDDLAQAPPGSEITLCPCTLDQAQLAQRRYQGYRYQIKRGLYGTGS
ncbi:biotin-dependent carboxyltransferase family protein [Ferrimonas sp.]|uniref:5-oxoprolinase subunit C family protein n=1 Tax=Ferrimonas sp. TaxID=2080861 RepID=UPI003A8E1644